MNPFYCGFSEPRFKTHCAKCNGPFDHSLEYTPVGEMIHSTCMLCGYTIDQRPADWDPQKHFVEVQNKYEYPEDRYILKNKKKRLGRETTGT